MDTGLTPDLHPACLPLRTQVGPWRVEAWAGCGVHGAVYRAVPIHDPLAAPVALKVALFPNNPRFAREVEVLSRAHHPSLPELYGYGAWQAPGGALHPFLAMQWVDGLPLYDWARLNSPSTAQALRLLAQLARALQALHALGCLHRDVKGGNVLIRRPDSHAFLMDLGSGLYPGAATLTPPTVHPGTPAYRAPESWLFDRQFFQDSTARYHAGPADDLYALGVTACRLLTGEYPELAASTQDERGTWRPGTVMTPLALRNTAVVDPELHALVLRMLSVHPEQRGTAEELAQALEQAAEHSASKSIQPLATRAPLLALPLDHAGSGHAAEPQQADAPLSPQEIPVAECSSVEADSAELVTPQALTRRAGPWLALAAGLVLAVWARWTVPGQHSEEPAVARAETTEVDPPGEGPAGLGEAAATSMGQSPPSPHQEAMAEEALPEPQPGQTRPDAKGRCPLKRQVALNGGCWLEIDLDRETCEGSGGRIFKKTCYLPTPTIPRQHPPTSGSTDQR